MEAWSAFLARFDNKKKIIRTVLENFFVIPKIKDEGGIRLLIDSASRILRGLKIDGEYPEN